MYIVISLGRMQPCSIQWQYLSQHSFPVPPSTHYCWVARGGVDSKLTQGFYTWPVLQESNPRPLDLRSYTVTTRPWASLTVSISTKRLCLFLDESGSTDRSHKPRIRPNRMKVCGPAPTEEHLAAIKHKKKVGVLWIVLYIELDCCLSVCVFFINESYILRHLERVTKLIITPHYSQILYTVRYHLKNCMNL